MDTFWAQKRKWLPKSSKNDKDFHYKSMSNHDSAKSENSSSVSQFLDFRKNGSKYFIKPMEFEYFKTISAKWT